MVGFVRLEIELSVLSRQCLERRIGDRSQLELEITTWEKQRNSRIRMIVIDQLRIYSNYLLSTVNHSK